MIANKCDINSLEYSSALHYIWLVLEVYMNSSNRKWIWFVHHCIRPRITAAEAGWMNELINILITWYLGGLRQVLCLHLDTTENLLKRTKAWKLKHMNYMLVITIIWISHPVHLCSVTLNMDFSLSIYWQLKWSHPTALFCKHRICVTYAVCVKIKHLIRFLRAQKCLMVHLILDSSILDSL